ncbi:MAG: FecR family protein [Ignavibacteriales bacterium]
MKPRLSSSDVNEVAGDWLAREDARALSPGERAELDAWLAADNRHLGAYLRLRAASRRLDRLGALKSDQPQVLALATPPSRAPRAIDRRLAAAIAVGVVLSGSLGLWASAQPRTYHTRVGEMRRVTLRDGSVLELNTDTVLKVSYSGGTRDVWLQRGEGNFVVAKDALHPFVVHVRDATFTAVGTVFSVRADRAGPVRLTVSEGVVSLKPSAPARPCYVTALQEASFKPREAKPEVASLSFVDVNRRLAWTEGRIALAGETLGQAAEEFNRYNDRKLVVAPAIASARVGGVFRTSEVETFARTAAASLNLEVRDEPDGDISLDANSATS